MWEMAQYDFQMMKYLFIIHYESFIIYDKESKTPSQLSLAQPFSLVEVVQSGSCIQWKFHSHLFPLIGKQTDGQVLLFHYIFFSFGLKCC